LGFTTGPALPGPAMADGMAGAGGFFPNTRANTPGFFSAGVSAFGAELAVVAGGVVFGNAGLSLSLSRSPKMRLRIGRFAFSFSGSVRAIAGGFPGPPAFGPGP